MILKTKCVLFGAMSVLFLGCATSNPNSTTKELGKEERSKMLLQIANGALVEGDSTGALQKLSEAEKLTPDHPAIHHSKALAYYQRREFQTALQSVQKAVELEPGFSVAKNTLGKIYLDLGQYSKAEKPLKQAAQDPLNREAYKAWTNLGIIYYRQKKFSEAKVFFDKAIQGNTNLSCVAHYYRGHISLQSKNPTKAIEDYQQATKRFCGGFASAHLAMGIALARGGQNDEARKKFLEIQKLYPESNEAKQAMVHLRKIP